MPGSPMQADDEGVAQAEEQMKALAGEFPPLSPRTCQRLHYAVDKFQYCNAATNLDLCPPFLVAPSSSCSVISVVSDSVRCRGTIQW